MSRKVIAPKESKLAQAVFTYEQLLTAILPLLGEKGEEDQWLHNTIKQRSEHGAYHNLIQLELNFS